MTPAIRLLEQRKVDHEILSYRHDPRSGPYGEEAARLLGLDPETVFKTLVALLDGRPVLAMVPVSGQLDLKALARLLRGKRAVMAPVVEAERLTGYPAGGISPLGQKRQLPSAIHESAVGMDRIHVSAGRRGLELSLAPVALIRLTGARPGAIVSRREGGY